MVPIESPLVVSYLIPLCPLFSRYLMPKSRDLELLRFKVIQGQRSWCQSIALGSYSTSIDPIVVSLTVFEIFDCNFNDLELLTSSLLAIPVCFRRVSNF